MADVGFEQLAQMLWPGHVEEFLATTWGRTHLHIAGEAGKFAHLLPWTGLNTILRQHRLDFPRLRLARAGRSLPATKYLRYVRNARNQSNIPRLLPAALTDELRAGATLVLDAVDELSEPLAELATNLARLFHEHVQINAYAGWRTARGFDLHWDDHDVFILQIAGRKDWRVYGMTRPYPLVTDIEPAAKPQHEPLWAATLNAGDLLYIPRGWWHVALPLAEPTLHLTVGVHNRTGLDLLRWLGERMRASELARQDLPRFAQPAEQTAHLARLRAELFAAWDAITLNDFFNQQDAQAQPRPQLDLPWSALVDAPALADDARVRLTAPRPIDFQVDATGIVAFNCNNKRWRFAAAALLVLRPLANGHACTVRALCAAAGNKLAPHTVRLFLTELIGAGLLARIAD